MVAAKVSLMVLLMVDALVYLKEQRGGKSVAWLVFHWVAKRAVYLVVWLDY